MGKKKREHIVFDQMQRIRKSVPVAKINKQPVKRQKTVYKPYMERVSESENET